ncbi:hypothetical protein ACFYL6_20340 [Micromonospora sp. NPDC007208]|uniref:hypothetical protein n=1 Tax=Micromonospora sp. NPDC007208 TaxID=3364236 RepID=UPI00368BE5CA
MNEVRQVLEVAKAGSPPSRLTVDDIVASGRRRARWRRTAQSLGSAAGLAVVAGAAVFATTAPTPMDAPATYGSAGLASTAEHRPATASFALTFAGYQIGDYRVGDPTEVTPGYQRAPIQRTALDVGGGQPTNAVAGTLTVYRPGVFRPDRFRSGTPISVGGREGLETTLERVLMVEAIDRDKQKVSSRPEQMPALAWQYAPGAWATIESEGLGERGVSAQLQRQFAEKFTTTAGETVAKLPYQVTKLRAGWRLGSVTTGSSIPGDSSVSTAQYVPVETSFDSLTSPIDFEKVPSIRVSVAPNETSGPLRHPTATPCPVGYHSCDLRIDDSYYVEVLDRSETLSSAEILAIAEGLRFATVADPTTWYPVTGQ